MNLHMRYNNQMETEKLSFEQVCAEYEFAAWELAELVERGEIAVTHEGAGGMWFESGEILRYLRETHYFISLAVASRICNRSPSNLRHQVGKRQLRGKKVGLPRGVWVTTLKDLEKYMEEFSRG